MIELSVRHLNVTLQNTPILKDVSLDIENGAFVCIVGPSGAGKSTLLKQLNRLDPGKVGGEILWRGQNIDTYDVHQLRRQIAYIFQKAVMFEGTTEENIRMALQYGPKMSDQETEELYQHALEIAEITPNILKTPASGPSVRRTDGLIGCGNQQPFLPDAQAYEGSYRYQRQYQEDFPYGDAPSGRSEIPGR